MRAVNRRTRKPFIAAHASNYQTASRSALWGALYSIASFKDPPPVKPGELRDLTLITWNDGQEKGMLEKLLDRFEIPYLVLGKGCRDWKNSDKLRFISEALKDVKTPFVMGLDNFDLLLLESPAEALDRFRGMSCDLLFSAQAVGVYPSFYLEHPGSITAAWQAYQESLSTSLCRYLDAGAWIGKTSFCRDFFSNCLARSPEQLAAEGKIRAEDLPRALRSEQFFINWAFPEFHPKVRLDYDSEFFLNVQDLRIKDRLEIELPFSWKGFCVFTAYFAGAVKEFFDAFAALTRPLRGAFGLRRCQWKKNFE